MAEIRPNSGCEHPLNRTSSTVVEANTCLCDLLFSFPSYLNSSLRSSCVRSLISHLEKSKAKPRSSLHRESFFERFGLLPELSVYSTTRRFLQETALWLVEFILRIRLRLRHVRYQRVTSLWTLLRSAVAIAWLHITVYIALFSFYPKDPTDFTVSLAVYPDRNSAPRRYLVAVPYLFRGLYGIEVSLVVRVYVR
jgi:hypothetical protein